MSKTTAPSFFSAYKGSGSVSLSWSYIEGDSYSYYFTLQRSANNGSWTTLVSCSPIHGNSYSDPIQSGWKTVQYGVKVHAKYSFDTDSDWVSSDTLTLNSAPTTPSGPYLPSSIQGGSSCSVSWGASSDSDGNLSGYKLERSLNGGAWGQVYSGAATSYSDYIGTGYSTVAYRVKAYDSFGAESGYATSSAKSITNNRAPSAPSSLNVPSTVYGGASCAVSWGAASDADGNLSGYKLERSLNGGTWNQIYSGSGRSYSDTIGTGYTTVAYRVRAYDSQGATSGYITSATRTIVNNSAPSIPEAITLPDKIQGGKEIVISWNASTDPDNNLSGYKLERSLDGGSTWKQIYQSSATSANDVPGLDWTTVQYRVCAYDTPGLSSGWRVSAQHAVIQNQPPSTPETLTVPLGVTVGEPVDITWSGSADPEGQTVAYELERSLAEDPEAAPESWEQIYEGQGLSYRDTAGMDWTAVTYRVRAYDVEDAFSEWRVGSIRAVDHNHAPVIVSDFSGNLGEKTEGFSIVYSVSDPEGDGITVTESLDKEELRKFEAVPDERYTCTPDGETFLCLLNGSHTLTVTATDEQGKSAVLELAFTKAVHRCRITMEQPFEADDLITKTVVGIARNIPVDADFQVLLTNNAKDDEPVWEDATRSVLAGLNYAFVNETAAKGYAYNFIVTVERGESGQGGYIDSIGGAFE